MARVWGLVERVSAPEAQLPTAPKPAVKEVHWSLMALTGTAVQPASVEEAACAVIVQLPNQFPAIPHWSVAVLLPFTGVTSGLGEENVMVEGVIVGPVMVVAAASHAALTRIKQANVSRGTITGDR